MKKILFLIIVGVGITLAATSVPAAPFIYPLNFEYTDDGVEPAGDPPWLTAEIRNDGDDTVRITMSTSGLTGTEFVSGWYFNMDFDINDLHYGEEPDPGPAVPLTPPEGSIRGPDALSVSFNPDGIDAGGSIGQGFDIFFNFPVPAPNSGGDRFGAGETVVYQIIAKPGTGLDAEDFDVFNVLKNGEDGTLYTSAHVQDINVDDSGWIGARSSVEAIPEPATILLLGTGLASLLGIRRIRFKKK